MVSHEEYASADKKKLICLAIKPVVKLWECTNGIGYHVNGRQCTRHGIAANLYNLTCSVDVESNGIFYCTQARIGEDDEVFKYYNVTVRGIATPSFYNFKVCIIKYHAIDEQFMPDHIVKSSYDPVQTSTYYDEENTASLGSTVTSHGITLSTWFTS